MALVCEFAETGCREERAGDTAAIELWLPPERARDGAWLCDALRREGVDARVTVAEERTAWAHGQRRFHRPFVVAERLYVRPPWVPRRPGLDDVVIEPAMAFGTGQHATTRSCLELLVDLPRGSVLDAGCGSGILSVAARRLEFDPVWAVDDDPLAVEATIANARENGVGLRIGRRSIGRDRLPCVTVLLANLTATVLGELARALPRPFPRHAVLSGLRPFEAGAAAEAFARDGSVALRTVARDGWATVLMGPAS